MGLVYLPTWVVDFMANVWVNLPVLWGPSGFVAGNKLTHPSDLV